MNETISAQEFESRHERVREFLRERDLGALFVYSPPAEHKWGQTAHVAYLSGWANHDRIVDSVVVVPVSGPPALLFAGIQYMQEQAEEVSPLEDIRLVQAVDPHAVAVARGQGKGPRDFASETVAILEENGVGDKDVGVVGIQNMPLAFYEALAAGLGSKLRRTDDVVARLRGIKSPAEVKLMKRAAELSDLGFRTMLEVARPGMRGIEVLAEMERVVRREGADHAKYWMASGPPTDWSETRLDIKPHERVLGEGDLMASCSYVVYKGLLVPRPTDRNPGSSLSQVGGDLPDRTRVPGRRPGTSPRRSPHRPGRQDHRRSGLPARDAADGGTHRPRDRDGLQRAARAPHRSQRGAAGRGHDLRDPRGLHTARFRQDVRAAG